MYELNRGHWEKVEAILQRREVKRQPLEQPDEATPAGSPTLFKELNKVGDPTSIDPRWLVPEALAEVREWLIDATNNPLLRQELLNLVPEAVVKLVEAD